MVVEAPFAGSLGPRAPALECRFLMRWTALTDGIAMCQIAYSIAKPQESAYGYKR